MKVESAVAVKPDRDGGRFVGAFIAVAAMATLLLASPAVNAAEYGSGPVGKSRPVTFESIPGSTVKRVILTAKAAERLGIETGRVGKERIVRKQMVGGQVVHPLRIQRELARAEPARGTFGGFKQPAPQPVAARSTSPGTFDSFGQPTPQPVGVRSISPADGETWVRMTLSEEEWGRVAQDKPARILPLATRGKLARELLALPSGIPPVIDRKRTMLTLYYVVLGKDHGLKLNSRMRIELQLAGSDKKRKVAPYSALYYDGKGVPWVYVQKKPLVYERQRVDVERIVGEWAVLNDGPPVGTEVVTVGAALLFGAEVVYKR